MIGDTSWQIPFWLRVSQLCEHKPVAGSTEDEDGAKSNLHWNAYLEELIAHQYFLRGHGFCCSQNPGPIDRVSGRQLSLPI